MADELRRLGDPRYFLTIVVACEATHCHCPARLIHVSVHCDRPLIGFPLDLPLMTTMP